MLWIHIIILLHKGNTGCLVPAWNILPRDQVILIQLQWLRGKISILPCSKTLWTGDFLERKVWVAHILGSQPYAISPLSEMESQWWPAVCVKKTNLGKRAGRMAASPDSFLLFEDMYLETLRAVSQFSISALCAARSVHIQFLNAGLHLVWRAVIKWGFGCPRQPDNRNFPVLMSSPKGSVLLVPPDLTAAMHFIRGNLGNCSEVPASVAGGALLPQLCATGRGFLACCCLSYSSDCLHLLSQQQQLAKDAPNSLQVWL